MGAGNSFSAMTTSFSFGTSRSRGAPWLASAFCTVSTAFLASCGSPPPPANVHAVHAQDVTTAGVVDARGKDEALVLQKMADLPVNRLTKVGTLRVRAAMLYRSASGRNCRDLTITRPDGSTEPRLACTEHLPGRDPDEDEAEGQKTWVFVPSVFVQPKDDPTPSPAPAQPADVDSAASAEADKSTETAPATAPSVSALEKDSAQ